MSEQPAAAADPEGTRVTPSTPLRSVVGPAAERLRRAKGWRTVGELLDHLPRRYHDARGGGDFSGLVPGEEAVVIATVRSAELVQTQRRGRGPGRILKVTLVDAAGRTLQATFFRPWGHDTVLVPGARAVFAGKVGSFRGQLQLGHPVYTLIGDETGRPTVAAEREGSVAGILGEGLVPVYPAVRGLNSMQLAETVGLALGLLDEAPDALPPAVRARQGLPGMLETYRWLHRPASMEQVEQARRRLRFEEAFVIQTVMARRARERQSDPATPRAASPQGLAAAFDARLPFQLTAGQREVGEEIAADLARATPMHRLLQGDVGAGKTLVALRAMLTVVDAGGQAALLAPTEVLAQQHHRSITRMLGDLASGGTGLLGAVTLEGAGGAEVRPTRVTLLTGSLSAAQRREALAEAASGAAGIVVGTHALLEERVQFADLGLVVVDEQHRFGVEQRDALRAKGIAPPHVLVMTATPIPRTVAMTVYGDMTTSVLGQLPEGRSPVTTHVVPLGRPGWFARALQRVADEVRAGHQAYVVCPAIGGDEPPGAPGEDDDVADLLDVDDLDARPLHADDLHADDLHADGLGADEGPASSGPDPQLALGGDGAADAPARSAPPRPVTGVVEVIERLRGLPQMEGLRLGLLHGRLPTEEKDAVMAAFASREIDVLVATTVVEVGVDVPNATAMVILDAERFGVSQLHQLRGRVGRGSAPGLCFLVSELAGEPGHPAAERLEAVAATTDGFELSRLDLRTRREGDVLGASQSGAQRSLRHLRLLRDEQLIVQARDAARQHLAEDPALTGSPLLARRVDALDAGAADWLERG